MSSQLITKIDPNMAVGTAKGDDVRYLNADDAPLRLTGMVFRKPGEPFSRMPLDPALPENVQYLAYNTAGVQLAFRSNSSRIRVRVKLGHDNRMDHMARIGSSGFDLYVGGPERRIYAGSSRFPYDADHYEVDIIRDLPRVEREWLLNFPLYSGVDEFALGLDSDATVSAPAPWRDSRPVVFYGTSITQGGCASRPGMAFTNMLSRHWNVPVINLGFSGSGKGEKEVVEYIAQIPDMRLLVLDYEANAGSAGLKATLERALDQIRARSPELPVVVLTQRHYAGEFMETGSETLRGRDQSIAAAFQRGVVEARRLAGDRNIYFVCGAANEDDWHEHAVDGVHPTDYGFACITKMLHNELDRFIL